MITILVDLILGLSRFSCTCDARASTLAQRNIDSIIEKRREKARHKKIRSEILVVFILNFYRHDKIGYWHLPFEVSNRTFPMTLAMSKQ